jgi:glycosyltransferase involved in cell wall biosynthesis
MPVNAGAEAGPPVASIVIPTYNTPSRFLHAAVHSALEQTLPVEVIVVDDGSRDVDVVPGVNEGLVKLVRHPTNKGVAEALNSGFREATTDWICWLSADDLIAPTKIQRQLQAALVTGSKAVCHGYSVLDDANGAWQMPRPAPWYSIEDQQAALVRGCCINGSTTMIHRSVFNEVGLYDSSYRYSQDWEMWLRIGSRYLWHYLPDNLGTRRESLGNLTARIRGDDEKSKVRNAEDAKIRAKYAPTLATAIDALR